jgi:hypothetical protein
MELDWIKRKFDTATTLTGVRPSSLVVAGSTHHTLAEMSALPDVLYLGRDSKDRLHFRGCSVVASDDLDGDTVGFDCGRDEPELVLFSKG